MAADGLTITEQWIREKLNLQHSCLADVRSLTLPGTYEGKICHLGASLKNFVSLKSLDLSHNALLTVKGIEHLEMLERLNLYYNRLASLQDVFSLHKLHNLKELDLRLNPVVKKHPHYRLYLLHAITSLRKLDDCPVRDRERNAALMHFSSEFSLDTNHGKHLVIQDTACRSSDLRIKAMQKMMKILVLLEGNEEAALNDVSRKSPQTTDKPPESEIIHLINDFDHKHSAKRKQESVVPMSSDYKNGAAVGSHRVTFVSPVLEKRRSVRGETVFTPHPTDKQSASQECDPAGLEWRKQHEGRANPVLHPPRLTKQISGGSERKHKAQKGAYRKPMELLLGMMGDLWSEREESRQHRTLLMKMVQILSMMEQEVSGGEQQIQTLKDELRAANAQIERQEKQHQSEVEDLRLELQQTHDSVNGLNEQLKDVLEENVSLQKQLIKAERKLLSSRLKKIPHMEDKGVQSEEKTHAVPEADDASGPQESYRSLIARNERLLQQLEEALMSK